MLLNLLVKGDYFDAQGKEEQHGDEQKDSGLQGKYLFHAEKPPQPITVFSRVPWNDDETAVFLS